MPNDTFRGGDWTADFTDVTVGSSAKLLARLKLVGAGGALMPQAGDTFQISVEATPFTSFQDSSFTDVGYTAGSGIITNVPEPSTVVALLTGGLGLCVLQGRRWVKRLRARKPEAAFRG